MLPALGALTSLTGGGAMTPTSTATSGANGGTFDGSGTNTTGDFLVGSTKSTGTNTALYIAAAVIGLGLIVWLARRK